MPNAAESQYWIQENLWLAAAVFCDRALTDTDGRLSIIQVLDRLTFRTPLRELPAPLPPITHFTTVLILLKGTTQQDTISLSLRTHAPSGAAIVGEKMTFEIEEGNDGVQFVIPAQYQFDESGTYWTDVIVNDRLLTRMALHIEFVATSGGPELSETEGL